jgi:formyltetrahydrofolate deformylase
MHNSAILLVSCPDRKGVVASIADFIFRHNGNILFNDEHGDEESNLFLTRVEFDPADFDFDLAQFAERFAPIARDFQMDWRLARSTDRLASPSLFRSMTIACRTCSTGTRAANSAAKSR